MSTAKQIQTDEDLNTEFVITTFGTQPDHRNGANSVLGSQIWDGQSPYGMGHPFQWVIERANGGIRLRNLGEGSDKVVKSPLRELTRDEMLGTSPIEIGHQRWITIRPILSLTEIAAQGDTWVPESLPVDAGVDPASEKNLKIISLGVTLMTVVGLIALWMMPPPPAPTELIPEQYAKILLSPAIKKSEGPRSKTQGKEVTNGNVVQVFQSAAVQKTTRSLLDASAAKALFSKSSILSANNAKAAVKNIFDSKSKLSEQQGLKGLDISSLDKKRQPNRTANKSANYGGEAARNTAGKGSSLVSIASDAEMGVADGLTKEEVGKVVREHLGEVRYCYESALARQPGLEGKLVLSFTVRGNGRVREVITKESSGNTSLDNCIQNRLLKWIFPKPRQGVDVGVSYPFIFKSLGG